MVNILPRRYVRFLREKLAKIQADPRRIATGYAAGFLLGALPFMGIRVLAALALAALFKWSKAATLIGVYHINPLTGPPFYVAAFSLGKWLLGGEMPGISPGQWDTLTLIQAFWNNGDFLLVLTTGCLAIALPVSAFLFWSSFRVVSYFKHEPPKTIQL